MQFIAGLLVNAGERDMIIIIYIFNCVDKLADVDLLNKRLNYKGYLTFEVNLALNYTYHNEFPLQCAFNHGYEDNFDIVQYMLIKGAKCNNQYDSNGYINEIIVAYIYEVKIFMHQKYMNKIFL